MNTETPAPEDPAPASQPDGQVPDAGDPSANGAAANGSAASGSSVSGAAANGSAAWPAIAPPGGPYNTAHLPAATDPDVQPTAVQPAWHIPLVPTIAAATMRQRIIVGVAVAAVIGALGFPLGLLWSSVAPWLPAQLSNGNLIYADPEGEQRAGAESWFILLSLAAGVVFALVAWFALRRFRGSVMLAALAIGSIATGWIAWWYGHNLGLDHAFNVARHAKDGTIIQLPPDLRIKSPRNVAYWHHLPYLGGDILYVAFAAVAIYAVFVGFSTSPSLGLHKRNPDAVDFDLSNPDFRYPAETAPPLEPHAH